MKTCPICFDKSDDLKPTGNQLCEPGNCKHVFHFDCLYMWTCKGENKCPYCKQEFSFINKYSQEHGVMKINVEHKQQGEKLEETINRLE